ncbi:MAG: hypothetical protein Q8P38_01315 [Candidatus Nanopelagicales bacterium]|nr:hypothetical protein [Candidatus Nanopelagicales bacterium]
MASRTDEMRDLVDGLVGSARTRVEGEAARLMEAGEDARERAVQFTANRASVDDFIEDLKERRLTNTAEDDSARRSADDDRKASAADFMSNVQVSVAGIRADVSNMLGSLLGERKATSDADHQARDEAEKARLDDAANAARERVEEVAQRVADVAADLTDKATTRKAEAEADHQARDEAEKARLDDAANAARARVEEVAQRVADVAADLTELADDRAGAADLWREGVKARSDIRSGGAPAAKPKAAKPKAAKPKAAPATKRRPTSGEIFSYLADSPDGKTLVELGEHFDVARIVLTRSLKELRDQNLVSQDEATKTYLAI